MRRSVLAIPVLVVLVACGGTSETQKEATPVIAPAISSFTARERTFPIGAGTTLTAVFEGGVGRIDPGAMPVTSGTPVVVKPYHTTGYTLTVTSAAGQSVTRQVRVWPGGFVLGGGWGHAVARRTDGSVVTWGTNASGQLGLDHFTTTTAPTSIASLTNLHGVSAGWYETFLLKSDGSVWACGSSDAGSPLGVASEFVVGSKVKKPAQVGTLRNIVALATLEHRLALESNGDVWAWGNNSFGQVCDGTRNPRNAPIRIPGLSDVVSFTCYGSESHFVKADGSLWKIAGSSLVSEPTPTGPVRVQGIENVVFLATHNYANLALLADGTVWSWGHNVWGVLGDGTTQNRATPMRIPELDQVVAVAISGFHAMALRADGTVWTWGTNGAGALGDGTLVNSFKPIRVPSLTEVRAIAAGNGFSLALKADGTVWAWGKNHESPVVDASGVNRPTPTKVSSLTGVGL